MHHVEFAEFSEFINTVNYSEKTRLFDAAFAGKYCNKKYRNYCFLVTKVIFGNMKLVSCCQGVQQSEMYSST